MLLFMLPTFALLGGMFLLLLMIESAEGMAEIYLLSPSAYKYGLHIEPISYGKFNSFIHMRVGTFPAEGYPSIDSGREHLEFLMNLPVDVASLREAVQSTWEANRCAAEWARQRVAALIAQRYGQAAWNRER